MVKGVNSSLKNKEGIIGAIFLGLYLGVLCSSLRAATYIDEVGRKLNLPAPPQRIVSLAPSITEILFALQLEDKIVGVSNFCHFPPQAARKEKIGDYATPSLEKIVALRPDLVIGLAEGELRNLVERLTALKIPVYISNPTNLREIIISIQRIGALTSATPKGLEIAATMELKVKQIQEKVKGLSRPRVLHLLNFDPLLSAGKGTFIDDVIRIAGGRNLAETAIGRYPRLSFEEVLAMDPEVILLASMKPADLLLEQRHWWEKWKSITAVRHGRVYVLDADLIHRPSPRIIIGLAQVARALHPEVFKNH